MNNFHANIENIEKNESGIWLVPKIGRISFPSSESEISERIDTTSFWFAHRKKLILKLLKKIERENALQIDVGGGAGSFSYELQKLNNEMVWLIEPTIDGARAAVSRGVHNVINSTFNDLSFKEKISGNIFLLDVVEHIESDHNFLKNLSAHLETDSHIFITVPSFMCLWSYKDTYFGHYRRYRLNELKMLAADINCEVVYSNYFFSFLFLPMLIRSILYKILNKKYTSNERVKEHGERNKIVSLILPAMMDAEIFLLLTNFFVPFGSSAIFVMKKNLET